MKTFQQLTKSKILAHLLDENNSPVARMRLFSNGIGTNNRIVQYEPITGDKGCLACGNCVDACPVVREKRRFVFGFNQRTSMSLETIVGEECRRCHACVRACPQVSKATKEFVSGFRRVERYVHAATGILIFFLAGTGIFMFHFKELLPGWQQAVFKAAHTVAGFLLLLMPLLYFLLDRAHLKRAVVNSFRFGARDVAWLKDFRAFLKNPQRNPLPDWREFNTYHKFWFAYLAIMIPVLGATGIVNLVSGLSTGPSFWIHAFFALTVDLLVMVHLYFKLIRRRLRDITDMGARFRKSGDLRYPFLYDPAAAAKKVEAR